MRVSNRCYAVTGLGYMTPWCVNAGFITGDDITLVVDTGANAMAASSLHGYATSVRSSNQLRVINTEKHFDHIGGNNFFRGRGIDVWGHLKLHRTEEEFQAEMAEFNQAISNPVRRERREASCFYTGTSLANPNQPISQDTSFELGNCTVGIFLTPGHTPTNLSVWVPEYGVLFTGDCLINGYLPNLDAGTSDDWKTWLKSLDRVAALRPRAVIAGHGPVAQGDDVPRIIETVRQVLEESIARGSSPTSPGQEQNATPFFCNPQAMTTEERERYHKLTQTIFSSLEERRELADGYAFRLSPTISISTAGEWTELESKCCPFFDFDLEKSREQGPLWLRLTGSPGVKQFIRDEFHF
jgi:glyoxylase-like metal-dependent hydrolase (beta-lactamase superfamily II)